MKVDWSAIPGRVRAPLPLATGVEPILRDPAGTDRHGPCPDERLAGWRPSSKRRTRLNTRDRLPRHPRPSCWPSEKDNPRRLAILREANGARRARRLQRLEPGRATREVPRRTDLRRLEIVMNRSTGCTFNSEEPPHKRKSRTRGTALLAGSRPCSKRGKRPPAWA